MYVYKPQNAFFSLSSLLRRKDGCTQVAKRYFNIGLAKLESQATWVKSTNLVHHLFFLAPLSSKVERLEAEIDGSFFHLKTTSSWFRPRGSFWSSILNLRGVFWMNFQSLQEQQLFFLMLRETTLSKKSNWHNWWMVWLDMFMTLGCFSFLGTFANGILDKRYQVLAEWGLPQNACCATRRAGGKTDEMKTRTLRTWQVYFCCKRLVRWLKFTIFLKLAHSLQGCAIGFINFAQVSRGLFAGPKFYGICAIAWFRQE